jgi:hypothetical protein
VSRRRWTLAVAALVAILVTVVAWRTSEPTPTRLNRPRAASIASAPSVSAEQPIAPVPAPAIRGRILDADGKPVDGAAVRLLSAAAPYGIVAETATETSGGFALGDPPPSVSRVRVVADHDPEGVVTSAELRPTDGATIDVTLVLSPAMVRGTVVDEKDHPVAGVSLSVEGVPWKTHGAISDDAGAFRLPVVPYEATSLVAVAPGYRTARVDLGQRQDSPEVVVQVRLEAGAPIDGRVVDPDGNAARARVVACEGSASEARTTSGEDGSFTLPASTTGCEVKAEADDFAPSDPAIVATAGRLTLHLKPGGAISGTVVDERGRGIQSFGLGIESYSGHRSARGARKFEDARGAFTLDRLPPGSYVLTATAQGKPPTHSDSIEVRGGTTTTGVRIVLLQGGSVVGHVLDDHGAPLQGAELHFDLVSAVVDDGAGVTTGDTGAYRLDGAPAGPFTLRVQKQGFRTKLVPGLRVDSGQTLTQDVTLFATNGGAGMELAGIGAGLGQNSDGIFVAQVFGGDPADRAGLRSGDHIVSIDGEDASSMSVADAVQRLRGPVGTNVGMSIRRGGQTIDVVIERAAIVH